MSHFLKGGRWLDPETDSLTARDAPGLILLNGSSPLLGGEAQVHAYAPFWELGKVIDGGRTTLAVAARAFEDALEQPWSILGLLSQANYRWFEDSGRIDRFLAAMNRHWSVLEEVGARYTMGSRTGARLWDLPHLLKYVLAKHGVPQARLGLPLPDGGIESVLHASAAPDVGSS